MPQQMLRHFANHILSGAEKPGLDKHGITTAGSDVTWQRLTSRLCIFGKPDQTVPASILQLRDKPTDIVMSEKLAATIQRDELFQY